MRKADWHWEVKEHPLGMLCASGSVRREEDAMREAWHYGVQYAQDGPVVVSIRHGETVKRVTLRVLEEE